MVYARAAADWGGTLPPALVQARFRAALGAPGGPGQLGDGRPFWRQVVAQSTGVDTPALFEALYAHYQRAEAWRVEPAARHALAQARAAGMRLAVVSNWDTRLPATLAGLGLAEAVDCILCSGAVAIEKPHPALFRLACARLGVLPPETVHVGDDPLRDVAGARAAGCRALRWGEDLQRWDDLLDRLAHAR